MTDFDDIPFPTTDTPVADSVTVTNTAAQGSTSDVGTVKVDPSDTAKPTPTEKAKVKNKVLYIDRFRMTTMLNTPSGEVKSSFILGMYRGNPRLIIRPNDPSEEAIKENNYGRLVSPMDPTTFEIFLSFIERAAEATERQSYVITINTLWKNGVKLDAPELINKVVVGRTEDGRVWFTIQEGTRPTPRFVVAPGDFHSLVLPSGVATPSEASIIQARALVKSMRGVVNAIAARYLMGEEEEAEAVDETAGVDIEPTKKNNSYGGNNNGGNRGNWNNNRNGGGGGGNWNNNRNGNNNGGNRGNWNNNRNGGGGGNWNNNRNGGGNTGGGGNYNQRSSVDTISNDDIPM